ncbi:MAG: hypothetical protein IJ716_16660 [Lachnospiraceae bacterium]|nr:hypothetical protein [Lachnospiraceae bacterium]
MSSDFRISYPKTLKEYRDAGESLTAELAGAYIFAPAIEKAEKDQGRFIAGSTA